MTLGSETWDPTIFIEFSALVNGIAFSSQMNLHYFTQIAQSFHTYSIPAYWFSSGSRRPIYVSALYVEVLFLGILATSQVRL